MREAAFNDPALGPYTGTVFSAAASDHRLDPPGPEQPTVLVVVIAAISQDQIGLLTRPTRLARDRAGVQVVQQHQQLGDVVSVPAGQRDSQRNAAGVNQQVVLRARSSTIYWGWPRKEPPKRARTWEPSTAARDQSIAPAAFSFSNSF
jgi:mannitol/fructose-specific phosphotransferase system IIA component